MPRLILSGSYFEAMSTQIKGILVVIPEKMLKQELCWFQEDMGEFAVRTYLINNPEIITKNLKLAGINAWFYKYRDEEKEFIEDKGEADLVFRDNKTYYIVETKRYWKFKPGWKQVLRAVKCFCRDAEINRRNYNEVIAVLVTTDPSSKTLKKETHNFDLSQL